MYLQLSPLYPLKGTIASNKSLFKLVVIAPLRGVGGEYKNDDKSIS